MKKNIENATWFRKWNTIFFTVFLIIFLIPCFHFELSGAMTGTGRLILGGMILLLIFGWIRSIVLLKAVLSANRLEKETLSKEAFGSTNRELFSKASYFRNVKPTQVSKK